MRALHAVAALPCLVLCACAGVEETPRVFEQPPVLLEPPQPVLRPESQAEGSLWRGDESRRFLAFENRAKRTGDLVSVLIEEQADAKNQAKTNLDHQTEFGATLNSDIALQTLVSRPILGLLRFLGFTTQGVDEEPTTALSIVDAETSSKFDGIGKLERSASFTTKIACVVTEVTDSGLMRIEGERHLAINGETQIIRLTGFVRPEDIRIDNTLPSELVAAADIRYGGVGLVSEEQRMPWLARIMRLVLPF